MDIPELVTQRALRNGVAGRRWLDALPEVLADLAARWRLTLGESFSGGTAGYVAAATDDAGQHCVVKVAMPLDMHDHDVFARSVRALQLADGRGCVTLLAHDPSVPAVLLERLGPSVADQGATVPQILEAVTDTLLTFWRPLASPEGLPTGNEAAQWLARFIEQTWHELDRPCERAVITRALDLCERRAAAFDMRHAVLVHGDAHGWNTLAAGDGTHKFIDIEGLCSMREHDLAIPMREYNEPLLAGSTAALVRARAAYLAERCGADEHAVWEWGFIERVSTGLSNVRDFEGDGGAMFLEVARRCL